VSQYSTPRSVKKNLGRRAFLRATLVTAGAVSLSGLAAPGCAKDDPDDGPLLDGADYFPQSVASGDPRPDSVILWTRVEDAELADDDAELQLELSADAEFTSPLELEGTARTLVPAQAQFDRCAKAKVRGLTPATTYYYRFIHTRADGRYVSPVGRTKTAPAADSDVKLRFAVANCQDYNGRYYNSYAHMATMELDFIIHLGDYIYETTGDPSFQDTSGRASTFSDKEGAIGFHVGTPEEYYAASSLSNYRELYRTYRSDPALRKIHETVPMICTWDDHEFSDDAHGPNSTYFDGRKDESDPDRRRRANQVWFEYMPIDYQTEDFEYDPEQPFPGDIQIYRDFTFGKHARLVMTDLRSYRTDHLIPEQAFPGTVVLTQAELMAELGELPAAASPYVDIDTFASGTYKAVLVGAATQLDLDPAVITGNLDAIHVNKLIASLDNPGVMEIPDVDLMTLERGLAYRHLGKLGNYASIGSRYLVIKDTFDLWATINYKKSGGKTQDAMGAEQQKWFLDTMKGAKETWKLWGNEYSLMPLVIDLTNFPIEPFNQKFYMNADQWDGMRDRRDEILGELSQLQNVVALTGDIHAFYAGVPGTNDDPSKHIVEFVGSAISSGTYATLLVLQVAADPTLSATPGASDLAGNIDQLLRGTGTNRHLAHADSARNGFVTVELDGVEMLTTYHAIDEANIFVDLTKSADLASKFTTTRFKVETGKPDLLKEINGAWKRWDPATNSYV